MTTVSVGVERPAQASLPARVRLEEWLALGAVAALVLLKWWFGGSVRWLTFFTSRGVGLFAALGVLFVAAAFGHEQRRGPVRLRAVAAHGLAFLRDFLPFIVLIVVYENLLPLIGRMRPVLYDSLALRADQLLFGTTPAVWLRPLVTRARNEWFAFFYLSLFALPIVSGGVLYLSGRRRDFRAFMLAFTLAGLIGFIGYVLVPVVGPRYYSHAELGRGLAPDAVLGASFSALALRANELQLGFGHARNCFPSLHTAWGLIVLIFAYRQVRWLFFVYLLPVGSLLVATVFLRFHYAVDLLAGAVLAVVLAVAAPRLERRFPIAPAEPAPRFELGASLSALGTSVHRFGVAHWPSLLLLALLGPLYASSLPTGLATHNRGQDGAELVAAAVTGGTAHPPGYPLYLLVVRAACALVPRADPIDVAHALSAVCALVAGCLLTSACRAWFARLTDERGQALADVAAFAAGALFCVSPALFGQALIAEVYAFHALGVAGLAWLASRLLLTEGEVSPWVLASFGAVAGLSVSHHLTAAPIVAALGLTLVCHRRVRRAGLRGLALAAAGAALGFLPWLYLALAAASEPALSWGRPDTLSRFVWVVSAAQYRSRFGGHLADWLQHFRTQFPLWGAPALVLAFTTAGIAAPWVERRRDLSPAARSFAALFAALIAANVVSSVPYSIGDLAVYFIPSELGCAAFAGLGLFVVARRLGASLGSGERAAGLAVALTTVLLVSGVTWNVRQADAHGRSGLERQVRATVGGAGRGALIAARGDGMVFGLWYEKLVRSRREDLDIVGRELLLQSWYARNENHFTSAMRWPREPLVGNASRRLEAVIRANYGRRPIVVVSPADVPAGCSRGAHGVLACPQWDAVAAGG